MSPWTARRARPRRRRARHRADAEPDRGDQHDEAAAANPPRFATAAGPSRHPTRRRPRGESPLHPLPAAAGAAPPARTVCSSAVRIVLACSFVAHGGSAAGLTAALLSLAHEIVRERAVDLLEARFARASSDCAASMPMPSFAAISSTLKP